MYRGGHIETSFAGTVLPLFSLFHLFVFIYLKILFCLKHYVKTDIGATPMAWVGRWQGRGEGCVRGEGVQRGRDVIPNICNIFHCKCR